MCANCVAIPDCLDAFVIPSQHCPSPSHVPQTNKFTSAADLTKIGNSFRLVSIYAYCLMTVLPVLTNIHADK